MNYGLCPWQAVRVWFTMMYDGYGYGDGSGMWILMLVVFLVFLVIFGGFVVLLVLAMRHGPRAPAPQTSLPSTRAFAILDERLARGEISPEEYQSLRATLMSGHPLES